MAASHTLPHSFVIPQISKLGVLTLHGYGVRISMLAGHLQIEDGIGPDRRRLRLPRVGHKLKRLVCISEDGFVTLSALKWLNEIGASFVMLDRLGKVRFVTGPVSSSEARLRRAQALALSNGTAVEISRALSSAKLDGQETVVREKLKNDLIANTIARFRERLADADSIDSIRTIESHAAVQYWNAWYGFPIQFARKDATRVPKHWLEFGTRRSPLTGGPRLSVNPANSLLNFTFAVAESECRLAASACGLDPGIGFVHTDTANRDSLALDLIEAIRPSIEAWVLDWLMREPLRRSDFFETAPTWGRLVAPWAEYVAHSLWPGRSREKTTQRFKTPLTQTRRREAKGAPTPKFKMPKTQHLCLGCAKSIRANCLHCAECAVSKAAERFASVAKVGRLAAHTVEARAKQSKSRRKHAVAVSTWDPSTQPTWLTEEMFSKKIQPLLTNISNAAIRSRIGVSRCYAGRIRKGYCPHPRHWNSLAELVTSVGSVALVQSP